MKRLPIFFDMINTKKSGPDPAVTPRSPTLTQTGTKTNTRSTPDPDLGHPRRSQSAPLWRVWRQPWAQQFMWAWAAGWDVWALGQTCSEARVLMSCSLGRTPGLGRDVRLSLADLAVCDLDGLSPALQAFVSSAGRWMWHWPTPGERVRREWLGRIRSRTRVVDPPTGNVGRALQWWLTRPPGGVECLSVHWEPVTLWAPTLHRVARACPQLREFRAAPPDPTEPDPGARRVGPWVDLVGGGGLCPGPGQWGRLTSLTTVHLVPPVSWPVPDWQMWLDALPALPALEHLAWWWVPLEWSGLDPSSRRMWRPARDVDAVVAQAWGARVFPRLRTLDMGHIQVLGLLPWGHVTPRLERLAGAVARVDARSPAWVAAGGAYPPGLTAVRLRSGDDSMMSPSVVVSVLEALPVTVTHLDAWGIPGPGLDVLQARSWSHLHLAATWHPGLASRVTALTVHMTELGSGGGPLMWEQMEWPQLSRVHIVGTHSAMGMNVLVSLLRARAAGYLPRCREWTGLFVGVPIGVEEGMNLDGGPRLTLEVCGTGRRPAWQWDVGASVVPVSGPGLGSAPPELLWGAPWCSGIEHWGACVEALRFRYTVPTLSRGSVMRDVDALCRYLVQRPGACPHLRKVAIWGVGDASEEVAAAAGALRAWQLGGVHRQVHMEVVDSVARHSVPWGFECWV